MTKSLLQDKNPSIEVWFYSVTEVLLKLIPLFKISAKNGPGCAIILFFQFNSNVKNAKSIHITRL
jgi:hypothetical protein